MEHYPNPDMQTHGPDHESLSDQLGLRGFVDDESVRPTLDDIRNSGVSATEAEEIIRGMYHGHEIGFVDVSHSGFEGMEERESFAELAARNPYTADVLARRGVGGFHGTTSGALAGVLEAGGLMATTRLLKEGRVVASGEHGFQSAEGQRSISFATLNGIDFVQQYAGGSMQPTGESGVQAAIGGLLNRIDRLADTIRNDDNEKVGGRLRHHRIRAMVHAMRKGNELIASPDSGDSSVSAQDYPVIFGIDREWVRDTVPEEAERRLISGSADMHEFRPFPDKVPLNRLPVIAVPFDRIEQTRVLLDRAGYRSTDLIATEDLVSNGARRFMSEEAVAQLDTVQALSREWGESQQVKRFARVRSVAHKMIDRVVRWRADARQDYEKPFRDAWAETDAAWTQARGTNKAAIELFMVAKAQRESKSSYMTGALSEESAWGVRIVGAKAVTDAEKTRGAIRAEIPEFEINGGKWNVLDMNTIIAKNEEGDTVSSISLQCQRLSESGIKQNIRYTMQCDSDGTILKASAFRDHQTRDFSVRTTNIDDVLREVTLQVGVMNGSSELRNAPVAPSS